MADPKQQRARGWVWLLAGVLVLLAAFPYFERLMNANERPRLLQGMALVEEGSWRIDGPSTAGWKPGPDVALGPHDEGGHLYPNKPPGSSVVAAVAYGIHGAVSGSAPTMRGYVWWARLLGGLLPTLLIVVVAWKRYTPQVGPTPVLAALAIYVFATPVASYGRLLFGHQLAAALLFVGVLALLDATKDEFEPRRAALGGALAGTAVAVEYTAVFAGIPIAVMLLRRAWSSSDRGRSGTLVGASLLGALVPIAALAAYHAHCFGGPFTTPYHHVTDPGFAEIHGRGLLGLGLPTLDSIYEHLVSPWGGLLLWCPVVLVALSTLFERSRALAADPEARLCLGILALLLLVNLGLEQTGGWRVGPRYFVVALPFAIPGLVRACEAATTRPALFAALLGLSAWPTFANGLAATLFPHLIPVGNPLQDQLWPLWLGGRSPYGLTWLLGLGAIGPTLVVLSSLLLVVLPLARLRPKGAEATKALGLGLILTAVLALVTVLVPADPAAGRTQEALHGMWEPDPVQTREARPLRSP